MIGKKLFVNGALLAPGVKIKIIMIIYINIVKTKFIARVRYVPVNQKAEKPKN